MTRKHYIAVITLIVLSVALIAFAQNLQAPNFAIPGNGAMVGGSDYTTNCNNGTANVGCFHPLSVSTTGALATLGASGTTVLDPCESSGIAKTSVTINITSATTSALIAVSGSTTIYVCGFSVSISQVVTTANTLQFGYSTVAACGSGVTALTGLYGAGGVTAGIPIVVAMQGPGTIFKTPASNGLCVTTAIGASGSFQGVLSYVQQ